MVRPKDHIGEAITIDVTGAGYRVSRSVEAKTVVAVEGVEPDRRSKTRGLAEHHIARLGVRGPDDDIGEAVAIDIAGAGDGLAAVSRHIIKSEADDTVERRQRNDCRELGG